MGRESIKAAEKAFRGKGGGWLGAERAFGEQGRELFEFYIL